ncbi:hypothetical protein ACHQM5_017402 [Ranunculus cassubicifolius]
MSRFHGYFLVMLLVSSMVATPVSGQHENPLAELSTRSQLVELAGYGEEKLSSVVVTGTVVCEACLEGEARPYVIPVSGALVGILCKNGKKNMKHTWAEEAGTNEYGDFLIDLPSHLHAIQSLEKACFVKVLRLPKISPCKRVPNKNYTRIMLQSAQNNVRTYITVGDIRVPMVSRHASSCLRKQNHGEGKSTTW